MNVMETARSIGVVVDDGAVSGTIDEAIVLAALTALAADHPGNDDLFEDAAARVRLARSAGVEHLAPNTVFNRSRTATIVQLRYRMEMADVFTDLAIDIGLRGPSALAVTPV